MEEEKKGVLGKALDYVKNLTYKTVKFVKNHMPSAKSVKKGAAVLGAATTMAFMPGAPEVDAAPHQTPTLKHHSNVMINETNPKVLKNITAIKFGKHQVIVKDTVNKTTRMQEQKKEFNDRIQFKQQVVDKQRHNTEKMRQYESQEVIKLGKSPNDKVKNPKLWKPKRDNKKQNLPNIPGATIEEKIKMAELNRIYGDLHNARGTAMFFKNQAEVERLTQKIREINIQRQELRNAINQRQKQSGYER